MTFQRVLHTLAATQEVPQHTCLHWRESTRVPPSSRGAPFPPHSSRAGIFPCVVGKEIPAFRSHLKRRCSPQERREELQGRATIPRVPRCLSPFRETCFPCTASTFKPRFDSHHGGAWDRPVGKPRGKASWESLVGKTRGKATDPLIHVKGSVTLLLQLGRKAHVHAPNRDED